MAVRSKLVAEKRVELGTAACRRLRRQGIIPGILYGHGADSISISLTEDKIHPVIQGGAQVVGIELEGKSEDFHARSSRVGHEVGEAAEEISDALELLGEELRKGYHRIRKAL